MSETDEAALCDAFVEAVHLGDPAAASEAGTVLVSKSFEGEFSSLNEIKCGVLLTEALIPQDPDDVHDSAGIELLKQG